MCVLRGKWETPGNRTGRIPSDRSTCPCTTGWTSPRFPGRAPTERRGEYCRVAICLRCKMTASNQVIDLINPLHPRTNNPTVMHNRTLKVLSEFLLHVFIMYSRFWEKFHAKFLCWSISSDKTPFHNLSAIDFIVLNDSFKLRLVMNN